MEAQKIVLNGCPNLWKVSDGLYRSAQPNQEGFLGLSKKVISVINLRTLHNDNDIIKDSWLCQFYLIRIPMFCWHPETEDVVRFLKTVIAINTKPLLVHCKHGSDRTGSMVALYRIIIEGWSKNDAIEEMILPQFGFHPIWENLVDWIEGVDIEKIKEAIK